MKALKRIPYVILLIAIMLVTACSKGGGSGQTAENTNKANTAAPSPSGEEVKLAIYSTTNDKETQDLYKKIGEDYTKEHPNVTFDFQYPGPDYENIMKAKMAANDLPDIFDTHGWAIIRYGNYLEDMSQQSWVSRITDSMKPIVTDDGGKVYALPLNAAKDGITYNKDVLDKYGIQEPETLDDLIAAGEKIKKDSNGEVTPFFFSATDAGSMAQFFDYYGTAMLISPEVNHAQELLDGTFDWSNWTPLAAKFKEMFDKGLMPKDVLTVRESDRPKLFAEGKIAFIFTGPGFVPDAQKINPDVKVGIMPVPAFNKGDTLTFSGGERFTMGVFKDSKHKDVAMDVVEFFSKPEYMKQFAEVSGTPTAMEDVTPDLGIYTEFYDKYKDVPVFPYFDRVYLPSGMWDVMQSTSAEIVGGTMTPEESSDVYKKNVERLRSQQK